MDSFFFLLPHSFFRDMRKESQKAWGWAGLAVGALESALPSLSMALLNHTDFSTFHFESEELFRFLQRKIMARLNLWTTRGKKRKRGPQEILQRKSVLWGQTDRLPGARSPGSQGGET